MGACGTYFYPRILEDVIRVEFIYLAFTKMLVGNKGGSAFCGSVTCYTCGDYRGLLTPFADFSRMTAYPKIGK